MSRQDLKRSFEGKDTHCLQRKPKWATIMKQAAAQVRKVKAKKITSWRKRRAKGKWECGLDN